MCLSFLTLKIDNTLYTMNIAKKVHIHKIDVFKECITYLKLVSFKFVYFSQFGLGKSRLVSPVTFESSEA